jgi:hypothetical protein
MRVTAREREEYHTTHPPITDCELRINELAPAGLSLTYLAGPISDAQNS